MDLTRQYTLVGINFSSIDGLDSIPVAEAISGDFANGDELQIQDDTGRYIVLVWQNGTWCSYGTTTPATTQLKRGTGVWVVSHGGASTETPVRVQLKGAVNLSDNLSTEFGNSYVIAATGLPVDVAVNGPLFTWERFNDGDELQIPDATGRYIVLQWNDATKNWVSFGSNEASTVTIPKESAIWVVSTNPNAKVTISPAEL